MLDLLQALFFENLVLLALVEIVALAVVVAVYRRNPTVGRQRAIWIAIAVCLLLIAVQHFVQTDRERIEAAIRAMAVAVDEGDIPALSEHLNPDFEDRGLDKQAWLTDIRERLQRWQIDQAKVGGFTIDVQGERATASFWGSCNWRSAQQSQQGVYSTWKLGFTRRENGWKLHRVIAAKFGPGGLLDYTNILQY